MHTTTEVNVKEETFHQNKTVNSVLFIANKTRTGVHTIIADPTSLSKLTHGQYSGEVWEMWFTKQITDCVRLCVYDYMCARAQDLGVCEMSRGETQVKLSA